MKKRLIVALSLTLSVALLPLRGNAEEGTEKAPVPAPQQQETTDSVGGCKPDGSCCGAAACAHKAGDDGGAKDAAAGCPCQRMKALKEKGSS